MRTLLLAVCLAVPSFLPAFTPLVADPWGPFSPGAEPPALQSVALLPLTPNAAGATPLGAVLAGRSLTALTAPVPGGALLSLDLDERHGAAALALSFVPVTALARVVDLNQDGVPDLVLGGPAEARADKQWTEERPWQVMVLLSKKDGWNAYTARGFSGAMMRAYRAAAGGLLVLESQPHFPTSPPSSLDNGRLVQVFRLYRLIGAQGDALSEADQALEGFPKLIQVSSPTRQSHHEAAVSTELKAGLVQLLATSLAPLPAS